jgi:hypothetical protein
MPCGRGKGAADRQRGRFESVLANFLSRNRVELKSFMALKANKAAAFWGGFAKPALA